MIPVLPFEQQDPTTKALWAIHDKLAQIADEMLLERLKRSRDA